MPWAGTATPVFVLFGTQGDLEQREDDCLGLSGSQRPLFDLVGVPLALHDEWFIRIMQLAFPRPA